MLPRGQIVVPRRLPSLPISCMFALPTGAGSWQILCTLPSLTWFEHCPFNCNSGPFLFDSREAMLSYIWEFLSPEGRAYSAQLPSVTGEMAVPAPRRATDGGAERAADAAAAADSGAAAAGAAGADSGAAAAGAAGADSGAAAAGAAGADSGAAAAGTAGADSGAAAGADSGAAVAGAAGADSRAAAGENSGAVAANSEAAANSESSVETDAAEAGVPNGEPQPPNTDRSSGAASSPHGQGHQPQAAEQAADPSRESSVGADRSSASSSDRHVSPLSLSRSASGSGCGSPRRLRIENFWLFNPKTEELALSRLCPAVRLLRLDFVFQDMGRSPDLAGLANLRHVTRLEINSFDAPRFSVMSEVLRQLGGQLTELALHVCDDYTATAALENSVARWCPRLERYSFTGDYSVRLPAERGDDDLDFSALRRRHPALRELTLGGFVTGRRLLFILAHATGLRRLRLDGELRYLDDAGFRQLVAANPLHQLIDLWINCSTALTLQALLPILFDPQCALRRLGRLSSLQGLDRAGFLQLRDQVRSLNLDLELVWVTPGV